MLEYIIENKKKYVLRINNLKMKPDHNDNQLYQEIKKVLGFKNKLKEYQLISNNIHLLILLRY